MPSHTRRSFIATTFTLLLTATSAWAQPPQVFDDGATRYAALGDSIAAGFKAQPATQGYAFLLYQGGAFDRPARTLFNNLSAVGATSEDVLLHQVPQVLIPAAEGGFLPDYVTLTVGGNDLAAILRYAATGPTQLELQLFIQQALGSYTQNLSAILQQLVAARPDVKIFVSNQYTVPELEALLPGADLVIAAFNQATATVVSAFPTNAYLVNVYEAFLGRTGLLLIERRQASFAEVHLTNAGHRAMANAFAEVIEANK